MRQIAAAFAVGASKKKKSDHLGLGLPLARRAVEDVGGQFVMYSPPPRRCGIIDFNSYGQDHARFGV